MLRAVADFPMKLYVPYEDLPYPGAHCRSDDCANFIRGMFRSHVTERVPSRAEPPLI